MWHLRAETEGAVSNANTTEAVSEYIYKGFVFSLRSLKSSAILLEVLLKYNSDFQVGLYV